MDHRPRSYKTLMCFSPLNYRSIPKCKTLKAPDQSCTPKLIFLKGSSEREEGALTSSEDPWVHEGGHAEIGQHKEKHHRIVDGHCRRHGQAQPWTAAQTINRMRGCLDTQDSGCIKKHRCVRPTPIYTSHVAHLRCLKLSSPSPTSGSSFPGKCSF